MHLNKSPAFMQLSLTQMSGTALKRGPNRDPKVGTLNVQATLNANSWHTGFVSAPTLASRQLPPGQLPPGQLPPEKVAKKTTSRVDNSPPNKFPGGQLPPGQVPG